MNTSKTLAGIIVYTIAAAALFMPAAATAEIVPSQYTDYPSMIEKATPFMRDYLKSHPEVSTDSLQARILPSMSEGPIGSLASLTPARKKKLSPEKIYEQCRHSSLVFGKMEHLSYMKADSAFSTASAVVLTPDGVCATNYHVINDIVLRGALNHKVDNDRMRFVMDCDGNFYPVTDILGIDAVNDLAIIKIDPCGRKLTPAPIGGDPITGAKVYCLAHPTGSYFLFTDGMVSNCSGKLNKRNGQTRYIMDITADYGVGASGGPIFDECGNLVALVSSTLSIYADAQQQRNFQMSYKQTVPVFLIKAKFTD